MPGELEGKRDPDLNRYFDLAASVASLDEHPAQSYHEGMRHRPAAYGMARTQKKVCGRPITEREMAKNRRRELHTALALARVEGRVQEDVARAAGVHHTLLSRVLNRHVEPSPRQAAAIARALDEKPAVLFPDLNDEDPAGEPGLVTTSAGPGGGDDAG